MFTKHSSFSLLRRRALIVAALCVALLCSLSTGVNGRSRTVSSDDQIIEEGKFGVYETRHVQGEETYKITREGDDLVLIATLDLSPLDVDGPLATRLRVRRGRTLAGRRFPTFD